ncbi:hypothetical protein PybrP1_005954 [[Pythium] brassicae (nom. inval.)]|nr:hypothetical protein PybrP1_005954 [[Pythium] brassicae (nom. inval.)]
MVEKRRSPEHHAANSDADADADTARDRKRAHREASPPHTPPPRTPPPVSSPRRGLEPAGGARVLPTPLARSTAVDVPVAPLTFRERLPLLSEHERVYSAAQRDAHGTAWRVIWYPHGQNVSDDAVSIYIEMEDSGRDDADADANANDARTRAVQVEFVLRSQSGDPARHHRQLSRAHTFPPQTHEFGMRRFFARKELLNPANAFLTPDGLVEIDVHVHPTELVVDNATADNAATAAADGDDDTAADSDTSTTAVFPTASPSLSVLDALPGDDALTAPFLAYDSKAATGMVGLKNQGATCYMNSLLQTLFHLRAFRQAVYETPSAQEDTHDSVSLALQRVFYRLQTKRSAVSTKELTRSFGWSQIDAFMQHDVQELYRILCDRLEEKMKHTRVDRALQRLFEGKVRSFVECVHVDFRSFRDESFYDLQLDVKGCRDLYASFRKYVETELLQGDNQYEAEGHGKQDAKKGIRFVHFPPVLNIQLKRFEYDPLRDGMVKIHDRFEFPKTLVLDEFLSGDDGDNNNSNVNDDNGPTTTTSDRPTDARPARPAHVYHLHSVLVHSGDVHGGHYYVFIRPGKDIANSNSWFRFDDDQISVVDEQTAIEGSYGSSPSAAAVAGNGSGPSTPLYAGMSYSPDKSGSGANSVDFQSVEVVPDDDRAGDVYDYSRSNGDLAGPSGSSSSLMVPLVRSFSSAYMLVYVRDGDNDIRTIEEQAATTEPSSQSTDNVTMTTPTPTPPTPTTANEATTAPEAENGELTIPEPLVQRFHEEEKAHARRKKMQQTEHLYMTLRLASDSSVSGLKKITKTIDFSSFGTSACVRIRIKRAASIRQLYQCIYEKTGVPVRRQRLWKVITRENRTHRPDALVDETLLDCVERLIDEDASPKAPVRLFLQILHDELRGDDAGLEALSRPHKPVIHRQFLSDFAAPVAVNGDNDDAKPDDADAAEQEDEEMLSPPVDDADDDRSVVPPVHRNDILLFIKFYDVTKKLEERLEYMGNILFDARKTGAELAQYLHEALRIPYSKELVLYEEIQPLHVSEIELETRLDTAEIQNGDIVCYQYAEIEDDDPEASPPVSPPPPRRAAVERYPDVPQYFQYLLDRVEIVFRRHKCASEADETSFPLMLLYSNTYDDIVDALAAHLDFAGDRRLYLRLYQHSPLSNAPKKNPLRHAKFAGNDHVTLDELLTEFTERSTILYYEVLSHPITEIEAKRQVVVYFSIYGDGGGGDSDVVSPFVDPTAPQRPRRVEYLVLPTATVRDLEAQVRQTFDVPADTALRVCEVSHDGTRILQLLTAASPLDKYSSSSGYSSSSELALFVETVPADEPAVAAATGKSDAALANADTTSGDDDDEDEAGDGEDGDGDNVVLRVGVVHFNFQPNTHVYIHTHGVPFVVHFRLHETVREVKERMRQRIGVSEDEFSRWNFAAVKELRASVVGDVYDDMDADTIANLPMARLEEWCGAHFADIGSFGLEHADPKPATPKLVARRQEQGIRIRQN